MAIANIQAQIANLTFLLSQHIERTTMQSAPAYGVQGYQAHGRPQRGWENVDTWGYQSPNQSRNDLFSNTYNSDWVDHSNSMWWEPQQGQHEAYWQPYEEFYSEPIPPPQQFQPNSGSSIDCKQILDELISLAHGSQIQAKEAQHEGYWQPYEEFYATPMQPPQPPPQQFQPNSGSSMDNDQIIQLLTTLVQGQQNQITEMHNYTKELQNQANKLGELKNPMGEIAEFMGQIQEQSGMEVGDEPITSKPSQNMDEQWLLEEEEDDKTTASWEPTLPQPTLAPPPLPQPPKDPTPPTLGKVVPYSILSDPVPPNVPFPCRFMQSNEEEGEKGVCETFSELPENEVAGECLEFVKEDVLETTIPEEVRFYDTGQVTTLTINLAKCNSPSISPWCNKDVLPKTFEVVFVLEFLLDHTGKPSPRISNSFYTNMLLMIQAPTLEFKPLPDHFNYHHPFKDKRWDSSGCTTLKKALLGRQPMQSTKEDLESTPFPDLRP